MMAFALVALSGFIIIDVAIELHRKRMKRLEDEQEARLRALWRRRYGDE
jgi:hypothetical protein